MDRAALNEKSRAFFEDLWRKGDPWALESSAFEAARYSKLLNLVSDRHYHRVLEIGCGTGAFTQLLKPIAKTIVAIDISPTAIERARATVDGVDFRIGNIIETDVRADGQWDLVVMTETVYYLGWLYSFFDVGWLAGELFAATCNGGRLLLANTQGCSDDMLTLPWLIKTYRDLFVNVGYRVEREEIFRGEKDDTAIEVLMTVLAKDAQ